MVAIPYLSEYGYVDLPLAQALNAREYRLFDETMQEEIRNWAERSFDHHLKSDIKEHDRRFFIKKVEVLSDIITNIGAVLGSIGLAIGFDNPVFLGIMAVPSIAVAINIIGNTFSARRDDSESD